MGNKQQDEPGPDDPTVEEEALDEALDPTAASEHEVRSATENPAGRVSSDKDGNPVWEWRTDKKAEEAEETFDYLKALDNDTLSVQGPHGDKTKGYDPYDTASGDEED